MAKNKTDIPADIFIYASRNCPRCNVLKTKLANKGIKFHITTELTDAMIDDLFADGFTMLPVVSFDGELMDFEHANRLIESM